MAFSPTYAVDGIILDLRDNPGGLLDQSIDVANLFLTSGAILTTHGRHHDSHQSYEAAGVDYAGGLPMAVLIASVENTALIRPRLYSTSPKLFSFALARSPP